MPESDLRHDTTMGHQAGHEPSDLRPGYIVLTTIIGAAAVITSLLIYFKAAEQSRHETPIPRLAREREPTPEPRLQIDAHNELRQMRVAEEAALNSYGWLDKDSGRVRIPIERAMEILAKKGLPARKQEEKKP